MLGTVDLDKYLLPIDREGIKACKGVHWIICGGESGHGRRPMDLDWAKSIRDQCKEAGVPFFFKQVDKVLPIPDDLMIREFPIII